MSGRWADLPLRYKGLAAIAIPLVPLLVSAVVYADAARRGGVARAAIAHSLEVKAEIATVLAAVVDSEVGVHGYLLTRSEESLRVYHDALAVLGPAVRRLRTRWAGNPAQLDHLQAVITLAATRPLRALLDYARTSESNASIPASFMTESRVTMAALRAKFAEMQAVEDQRLGEHTAAAALAERRQAWVSLLCAALALAGGVMAVLIFTSGIAERITRLSQNAERLAQGETFLPLPEADDEVGQLSRSLGDAGALLTRRVAALEQARDELEAFSYSVSHDLRAPLRHVTGFAALLQRHAAARLDEQSQRYLKTIDDAARRMGRLIDDLLAFSRVGRTSLSKRRVALGEIVSEAQRDAVTGVNGRDVEWSVKPLPDVDADPALLRLAFVNLLSNAVKYTAPRPQAHIEVGTVDSNDGDTVVYVRDNGVGFDMAYVDKLFGVFQRLHSTSEFEGTGIGLANVKQIISRHGGRTWAKGAVDAGATFYVSLPNENNHNGHRDSTPSAG